MTFELITNVYVVAVNIIAFVFCLFRFIAQPRRGWGLAVVTLLSSFLSNYYWAVYMLLMQDYPGVSSFLAYFGWNVSYALMLWLVIHFKNGGERVGFHPLMILSLIPIPINVYQFTLYLPYCDDPMSLIITIWQNVLCTAVSCAAIQIVVTAFLKKKRKQKFIPPYVPIVMLLFITLEYAMWTSSCFDWQNEWVNPYNYLSILCFGLYIALAWAVKKSYDKLGVPVSNSIPKRIQTMLQAGFAVIVTVCCVGGYFLGGWMRDVIAEGMIAEDAGPYTLIAVILFIISSVIVAFAVAIMLVVRLGQKSAESDELREAKAAAENTSAAKSEFLANMSHEIRTPINAVLGMNEMILRESVRVRDDPTASQEQIHDTLDRISTYSENIDAAEGNLLSIVNDILDFSKIEAGKLELIPGKYRLESLLDDVCARIRYKSKSKGLDFRVSVDPDLPDGLYGDEVRVRQVLTNLLNNAVKYTERGSISLAVRLAEGEEIKEGEVIDVLISITDTGIGIKRKDISKLFTEFERIDLLHNSTVEGAGLGLSITKNLLDMMGGEVTVESVYGKGSVFAVRLPQRVSSAEPIGEYVEKYENGAQGFKVNKERKETFRAPDAHILVVDDTRMNITVVTGLLRNTGIMIDVAGNGEDAIKKCTDTTYDLILMDQRMPLMDGTEALHRIRETENCPNLNTPVICLTADAVTGARERYLDEGFTDYLTKPVDAYALEQTLLKYLPDEKIVRDDPSFDEDEKQTDDTFEPLRAAGIDPVEGLSFCQNDPGFYRAVLAEFAGSANSKLKAIEHAYDDHDWENYAILVHALKSTSKTIGADLLSSLAARLEARADAKDEGAVLSGHVTMTATCRSVVEAIRSIIPEAQDSDGDTPDILEFDPV